MENYLSQINALNNKIKNTPESDVDKLALLNAAKLDTSLEGGLAALSGGISLLDNSLNWAQGADMTRYDSHLADMANFRGQNYYDNSSLMNSYEMMPDKLKLDVGMLNPTAGQSAMHVGSNTLSGAMTGLTVGGPWGALIGGVVGFGSGLLSDFTKRSKNKEQVDAFNSNQDEEYRKNLIAFNTGVDQANDYLYSNLYKTKKAMGGFLRTPDNRPVQYRIHHSHCNGGTLVRIKAK